MSACGSGRLVILLDNGGGNEASNRHHAGHAIVRKVGGRPEAQSVWRKCKEGNPGQVASYDWEMVAACINNDLGPARKDREELQRKYGIKTHRTLKGVWHILKAP